MWSRSLYASCRSPSDSGPYARTTNPTSGEPVAPELTRERCCGRCARLIFSESSVYWRLKIGSRQLLHPDRRTLDHNLSRPRPTSILENNIVQTTGSASDSVAAGVVFTIPAILLMGLRPRHRPSRVLATAAPDGDPDDDPAARALIVKEHDTLVYPEGTSLRRSAIAARSGPPGEARVPAFGWVSSILQAGLKFWPTFRAGRLSFYPGAAVFTEASPSSWGWAISSSAIAGLPVRRRLPGLPRACSSDQASWIRPHQERSASRR